ncbi:MAG: hypothetical protein KDE27_20420, partial [Planctomycetes bacterium]|nr:hypothetical protein [Planctomycetota bacterium]
GRTEFMRSTKLARSIHRAMHSIGVDEDWRALELANVVLTALRERVASAGGRGSDAIVRTADIADAVQHVLVATGQPSAAVAYGAIGAERARRHRALVTLGRGVDLPLEAPLEGPLEGSLEGPLEAPLARRGSDGHGDRSHDDVGRN